MRMTVAAAKLLPEPPQWIVALAAGGGGGPCRKMNALADILGHVLMGFPRLGPGRARVVELVALFDKISRFCKRGGPITRRRQTTVHQDLEPPTGDSTPASSMLSVTRASPRRGWQPFRRPHAAVRRGSFLTMQRRGRNVTVYSTFADMNSQPGSSQNSQVGPIRKALPVSPSSPLSCQLSQARLTRLKSPLP